MYVFDCIQLRGGIACGEVKRGTVRLVFGTRSNFSPHFLKWLEKGLGLGSVYLSKLAYFLEESSMSMNSLAPETSHIIALKIKDYIISSLLLAHHYLRLIVDDHSYSGPGLSG
jgi:hypothetical protein